MDASSYTRETRGRRGARRLGALALAVLVAAPAAAVAASAVIYRRHAEQELGSTGGDDEANR